MINTTNTKVLKNKHKTRKLRKKMYLKAFLMITKRYKGLQDYKLLLQTLFIFG